MKSAEKRAEEAYWTVANSGMDHEASTREIEVSFERYAADECVRYRDALQAIAGADLKRVSAGWLAGIAQAALDGREII